MRLPIGRAAVFVARCKYTDCFDQNQIIAEKFAHVDFFPILSQYNTEDARGSHEVLVRVHIKKKPRTSRHGAIPNHVHVLK